VAKKTGGRPRNSGCAVPKRTKIEKKKKKTKKKKKKKKQKKNGAYFFLVEYGLFFREELPCSTTSPYLAPCGKSPLSAGLCGESEISE